MSSVSFLLRSQAVICRLNLLQDLPLQERDHTIFNGALFESATLESIFLPPCNFTHPLSCSCGNSYSCQRVRIPCRPTQFIHHTFCRCPIHQQPIFHSHHSRSQSFRLLVSGSALNLLAQASSSCHGRCHRSIFSSRCRSHPSSA